MSLRLSAVWILFALQNKAPVALDVLVHTFEPQSLALWVLCAFAIGGLLGMMVSSALLLRTRASLASVRRQLARAQQRGQSDTESGGDAAT